MLDLIHSVVVLILQLLIVCVKCSQMMTKCYAPSHSYDVLSTSTTTTNWSIRSIRKHITIYPSQLEGRLSDFNNFWYNYSWYNLSYKWLFKFTLHPTYASAKPGEIKTHKTALKWTKNANNSCDIIDSNLEKDL